LKWIQYRKYAKFLKGQIIIRETEIAAKFQLPVEEMHSILFKMADFWKKGPFLLFVKHYYIYVAKVVVDDAISMLKSMALEKEGKLSDVMKNLGQKYPFETRAETEVLIAKIRENDLVPPVPKQEAGKK
jgi:hypothetical protein